MKQVIDTSTGEITEYTDEEFLEAKLSVLAIWEEAKTAMSAASLVEKKAREDYVALVGNPEKTKGTEWDALQDGWRCKITKTPAYSFRKNEAGRNDIEAITKALGAISDTVENGAEVAGELIRWTPSLAAGVYDKLQPDAKKIINQVVIEGKSSVRLEIVPPKENK